MTSKAKPRPKPKKSAPEPNHSADVVELDEEVLSKKKFRDANPSHNPSKAYLYVGMTGHAPKGRFANHKRGYTSNPFVRDYGLWLRRRLYHRLDSAAKTSEQIEEQLVLSVGSQSR